MTELVVVTFKVDPTLLERLDAYAANTNASRSEVIRLAIELFLLRNEKRSQLKVEKPFVPLRREPGVRYTIKENATFARWKK